MFRAKGLRPKKDFTFIYIYIYSKNVLEDQKENISSTIFSKLEQFRLLSAESTGLIHPKRFF